MSSTLTVLLIVLATWAGSGLLGFAAARRQLRIPRAAWWIALPAGPLMLAFLRTEQLRPRVRWEQAGTRRDDGTALLAAIDGSSESEAAFRTAMQLVGDGLGRVALVTVIPSDADTASDRGTFEDQAKADLRRLALEVSGIEPDTVVLEGLPDRALMDHAASGGFDLICAGRSGRGLSRLVLGSVAAALVRESPVPVLIAAK